MPLGVYICFFMGGNRVRYSLSTIHSFFRYLAAMLPEYLDHSRRALNIPFKRMPTPTVEYLEFEQEFKRYPVSSP